MKMEMLVKAKWFVNKPLIVASNFVIIGIMKIAVNNGIKKKINTCMDPKTRSDKKYNMYMGRVD